MPHYKDGSEAKVCDIVKGTNRQGVEIMGIVVEKRPGKWPDMVVVMLSPEVFYVEGHEFELVHRPE